MDNKLIQQLVEADLFPPAKPEEVAKRKLTGAQLRAEEEKRRQEEERIKMADFTKKYGEVGYCSQGWDDHEGVPGFVEDLIPILQKFGLYTFVPSDLPELEGMDSDGILISKTPITRDVAIKFFRLQHDDPTLGMTPEEEEAHNMGEDLE